MFSFKRFLVVALIPFAYLPAITVATKDANELDEKSNSIAVEGEEETPHQHVTHSNAHKNEVAESPVEAIFHKMDSDHDASLSLDEFVTNFSIIGTEGAKKGYDKSDKSGKSGFWKGFSSSTMMIIATEIGDKTFFIAAVLSMRNSRLVVFSGAIFALICMTVLSTMMGLVLPSIMPKQYTHIIGGILFLYFGIKLIYDSRSMSDKVSDELEEVEEELLQHNKKDDEADIESVAPDSKTNSSTAPAAAENHKVFVQSFLLTFLAEWGDRSQIATIALAAAKNPYGVTIGGCLGHSLCTGLAVIGGRMLASKISEKSVSFWGGCIFLAFGVHSLFFDSSE